MKNSKLIREQLGANLSKFRPLLEIQAPQKGWIRAIRDALGMSAKQLAERTGMAQQRIAVVEKGEFTGAVTLKTMRRIAEGLDCVFVYGFVPKTDLETTLRKQAEQIAAKRLSQAAHTMGLENQSLSEQENRKVFEETVEKLIENPTALWNKI
ncbi:MAG TPA: mobile mystery protein A [Pontiellaceae bacterium]|nr:mobile mystery protein A [Pontiellaceae bacterium]